MRVIPKAAKPPGDRLWLLLMIPVLALPAAADERSEPPELPQYSDIIGQPGRDEIRQLESELPKLTGGSRGAALQKLVLYGDAPVTVREGWIAELRESRYGRRGDIYADVGQARIGIEDEDRPHLVKALFENALRLAAHEPDGAQDILLIMRLRFDYLRRAGWTDEAVSAALALLWRADQHGEALQRVMPRVLLAEMLVRSEFYAQASDFLTEAPFAIEKASPLSCLLNNRLAECYLRSGMVSEARVLWDSCLRTLLAYQGETPSGMAILYAAKCGLAECDVLLGEPERAVETCRQVLSEFPPDALEDCRIRLHRILADGLQQLGDAESAEDSLAIVLDRPTRDDEWYRGMLIRARQLQAAGDPEDALRVTDTALAATADPPHEPHVALLMQKVGVLRALDRTAEALDVGRQIVLREQAYRAAEARCRRKFAIAAAALEQQRNSDTERVKDTARQAQGITASPPSSSRESLRRRIANQKQYLADLQRESSSDSSTLMRLEHRRTRERIDLLEYILASGTERENRRAIEFFDSGGRLLEQNDQQRRNSVLTAGLVVMAVVLTGALALLMNSARKLANHKRESAESRRAFEHALNEKLQRELDQRTAELADQLEHRHRMERALEQTRKSEAIARLTSGVAHDFNNLMTVVLTVNEVLRLQVAGQFDDSMTDLLDDSTHAARSAADITRQLLTYSRRQALRPSPQRVAEFLHGVNRLLRHTLGDGNQLSLDIRCPDAVLCVDNSHLTTALLNLCANARDAIKGPGEVKLTAEVVTFRGRDLHPDGVLDGDYVRISVADNGHGMTEEQVRTATEPFVTTKSGESTIAGTGLGLSVVEGFLRQSGGQLQIESEVGRGTTVHCLLPLAEPVTVVNEPPSPAILTDSEQEILIVDDDRTVRHAIVAALSEHGIRTESASGPKEAKEILRRGMRPTLVLSDIRMQGDAGGIGFAEWMSEHYPDIRVILMTGYADQVAESGFDVICKPFQISELVERLSVAA